MLERTPNQEVYILLPNHFNAFKSCIFEKNDKMYRTTDEYFKIGIEVDSEHVFFDDKSLGDEVEYRHMVGFIRAFGDLHLYAYQYHQF